MLFRSELLPLGDCRDYRAVENGTCAQLDGSLGWYRIAIGCVAVEHGGHFEDPHQSRRRFLGSARRDHDRDDHGREPVRSCFHTPEDSASFPLLRRGVGPTIPDDSYRSFRRHYRSDTLTGA